MAIVGRYSLISIRTVSEEQPEIYPSIEKNNRETGTIFTTYFPRLRDY